MRLKRTRNPFLYRLGDHVFLRPCRHTWMKDPFIITGTIQHDGWPHYELIAPDGSTWQASQLELSNQPFEHSALH